MTWEIVLVSSETLGQAYRTYIGEVRHILSPSGAVATKRIRVDVPFDVTDRCYSII